MANFSLYFPTLLKFEGGWSNNHSDKGGCTNYGIILNTYKQYKNNSTLTCNDLKEISKSEVEAIYKKLYWDVIKGDDISSQSVAEILFDFAVNSGDSRSIHLLQKLVNTSQNGIMSVKTIEDTNKMDSKTLFENIKKYRKEFYLDIIKRNPSQKVFEKDWMNRINSFTYND